MNSLHFMAKYFCHQATKTQRNIQTKICLCAFESLWQFSGLSGLGEKHIILKLNQPSQLN